MNSISDCSVVLPNVKLRSAGEIPANLVYNSKILDTDNCYTIPSVLHQTLNLCSENTEALTTISSRVNQTFEASVIILAGIGLVIFSDMRKGAK